MDYDAGQYLAMALHEARRLVRVRRLHGIDPDDLAQDALMYLHREWWRFDPLRSPEGRFARVKIRAGLRHSVNAEMAACRGRDRVVGGLEAWDCYSREPDPSRRAELSETWDRAKLALTPIQYETCCLTFGAGLTHAQAGERLGVPESTVSGRLCEARKWGKANARYVAEVA